MFSHVMVGVNDMQSSKAFYDAILGTLGHPAGVLDESGRCFYRTDRGVFALSTPLNGESATGANGGTIGFFAKNSEAVDSWHAAGIANGGVACEDPPGLRPGPARLYLAYLRDPSGNKVSALHRMK